MKIYLDTNIYFSYLNPTSDIKSLEKLKKLLEEKKVELILTSQTKIEFLRHFKERAEAIRKKIQNTKTQLAIPSELKAKNKELNQQEKAIFEKFNALNQDLEKLRLQKVADCKKHLTSTEKLLKEIFKLATFFEFTDEVVLRAILRYAKDLPPKKGDHKFGDAIIWETLKENIRNEEIIIVSADPDFRSKSNGGKKSTINKILATEWKKITKKKAALYITLGQLVNTLDKEDRVSQETIRKEELQANVMGNLFGAQMTVTGNPSILNFPMAAGTPSSVFLTAASGMSTLGNSEAYLTTPQSSILSGGKAYITDLSTSARVVFSEICKNCGKRYIPNSMTANTNGWCDECLGRGYQIFRTN